MIKQIVKKLLKKYLSVEQYEKIRSFYCSIYHSILWRNITKLQKEFEAQAAEPCDVSDLKVSIICNCFNTNIQYLKEMLDSVLAQTYPNWELCLLDCSDAEHSEVFKLLSAYAKKNARIKVVKKENQGIALNTNYIASHATGEYLLLLDHDDLLTPAACAELVKSALQKKADFVYADEINLYSNTYKIIEKKEASLEGLWETNYINHPCLIQRELFNEIGGLRPGFEGSQDHDLYLRLFEKTDKISYVRKPLYVWRLHSQSFSNSSDSARNQCVLASIKTLKEHFSRTGIKAKIIQKDTHWIIKKALFPIQHDKH